MLNGLSKKDLFLGVVLRIGFHGMDITIIAHHLGEYFLNLFQASKSRKFKDNSGPRLCQMVVKCKGIPPKSPEFKFRNYSNLPR